MIEEPTASIPAPQIGLIGPIPSIHATAQQLIVTGHLPPPFNVDPHDGRPLWSFAEIATMFDRRPDELVEILIDQGPVHLTADRGVPSSWRMLIEP